MSRSQPAQEERDTCSGQRVQPRRENAGGEMHSDEFRELQAGR